MTAAHPTGTIDAGLVGWFLAVSGLWIAVHDLAHQRVRNRDLKVVAAVGVLLHAAVFVRAQLMTPAPGPWWEALAAYAVPLLYNGVVGLAVGMGVYLADLWSAGDAKLFAVWCLLLPAVFTGRERVAVFPAVVLLINAGMLSFAFLAAEFVVLRAAALVRAFPAFAAAAPAERRARVVGGLRAAAGAVPRLLGMVVGFMFGMMMMRLLRTWGRAELQMRFELDDASAFLLLFLAAKPLYLLFRLWFVFVPAVGALAWWALQLHTADPTGRAVADFARMGGLSLAILLFRELYDAAHAEQRWVAVDELTLRHIPVDAVRDRLTERKIITDDDDENIGVTGLTVEHIRRIRAHYVDPRYPGYIAVMNTIPFAPFLYAGLVATLVARGLMVDVRRLFGM